MSEEFIKIISDCYGIKSMLKKVRNIKSYPHIKKLFFDNDYILKKVNKIYCKDINTLYNYLSNSSYVELPLKTINDKYGIRINDELFILYPYIKKINSEIQSFYWAKALESIHDISINVEDFNQEYTIGKECFTLLNKSSELISSKLKKQISKLLDKYYHDLKIDKMVLSHGDPHDNNVMNNNTYIRLIDTDGARLLPREFDIARLFFNEVNREKDIDKIEKYINIFFYNYKNIIDMNLLKQIYVTDLLRSFSWLNLVTRDETRGDLLRQKAELKKYEESILSERHEKVLRKI